MVDKLMWTGGMRTAVMSVDFLSVLFSFVSYDIHSCAPEDEFTVMRRIGLDVLRHLLSLTDWVGYIISISWCNRHA